MKNKQGFLAGMDQDSSKNKRNPNSYYSMSNFRIITNEGLSSGSIETEKGTVLSFIVPDLAEMELTDGTIIPAQTDLKIIGWTTIRDTIVIFTTNNHADDEVNQYGQIWAFKYNELSNIIDGLTPGNQLDPSLHLKYNNATNFSSHYRIKAIGRYENENIQRVYFTDNYNPVRAFNIADPDSLDIDIGNIDLKPSITFVQPNIESIGVGNLPSGASVQFGYRLLDESGAQTLFSPLSTLVNLINADYNTLIPSNIDGTPPGSTNSRSVTYNIKGLDTNYTYIEHYIIVYLDINNKKIYKFREDSIPSSGEMVVTCDNFQGEIEVPFVEFNMLYSGFDVAKDIEVKNSRLIAANTKTTTFDLTFDARAYRFNSSSQALLKDNTDPDITLIGPTPAYNTVPEEYDAINIYNNEADPNWNTLNQYKYQADGTTLGGSGLNISYKFVTDELVGNGYSTMVGTQSKHVQAYRYDAGSTKSLGVLEADGSPKLINTGNQLANLASQWGSSNLVGYNRGETYRFGIVFYSKKGSTSFVKWIGDIKFPDVSDGYPIQDAGGSFETARLYTMGISFTVDISSIRDQISGYSIVRLERKEEDKTRLGSGMYMNFDAHTEFDRYSLPHRWETTGPNGTASDPSHPYTIDFGVELPGGRENVFHLFDRPGRSGISSFDEFGYLLSPIGQIYNNNFKTGDWIQTRGYYKARAIKYSDSGTNNSEPENDREYAFQYKLSQFVTNTNYERYQLNETKIVGQGEVTTLSSGSDTYDVINAYASRKGGGSSNDGRPLGLGNRKLFFGIARFPTITNTSTQIIGGTEVMVNPQWIGPTSNSTSWRGPDPDLGTSTDTIEFDGGDTSIQDLHFKEVVYGRYLPNQYKGNDFITRSKDSYISTNHYQVVTDSIPSSLEFKVYGGDTYINYYDQEDIEQYWSGDPVVNGALKSPGTNKLGIAVCLPSESAVNTDFRNGTTWAGDRIFDDMGAYQSNSYNFYSIYRQQNNTYEKFFGKDFLLNIVEEHPHQLWASDNKIDGELVDSWRSFRANNSTEVNGIYGPINRIITFKDQFYFYQDAAFGSASIDERSVIQDESGQSLAIGTGGVFPTYTYISNNTGAYHQYAVVNSELALYHYDARLRKVYRFNGNGVIPISDTKRVASLFYHHTGTYMNNNDHTTSELDRGGVGAHMMYDPKYNRILMTFLNSTDAKDYKEYFDSETSSYTFPFGDFVYQNGNVYEVIQTLVIEIDPDFPISPNLDSYPNYLKKSGNGFTISFNENLDAFESFYDYVPELYLNYGRRLLSVDPKNFNKGYVMNVGEYGKYYEDDYSMSKIETILLGVNDVTKVFNNLAYNSELYDNNNTDIYNETFDAIRLFNEYQSTPLIALNPSTNIAPSTIGDIRRRMRTWRYTLPRAQNNARFRHPWLHVYLEYLNNANKRLIMHELEYSYTPSPY